MYKVPFFKGNWQLQDNLKPDEGSMKKFKTEYNRCYRKYHFWDFSNEDLTDENEDVSTFFLFMYM